MQVSRLTGSSVDNRGGDADADGTSVGTEDCDDNNPNVGVLDRRQVNGLMMMGILSTLPSDCNHNQMFVPC